MLYVALLLLLSLASFSQQATPDEAKEGIAAAWKDAKERLIALDPVTKSVLDGPLEKLQDLYKAGEKSVNDIQNFKGPGDKDKATDNAVIFWKEKMEEIINPYLEHPENYKLLVIDYAGSIPKPDYERTDEYVAAEDEINKTVAEAEDALMKEYERVTGRAPATADEVAKAAWKKVAGKWPLEPSLEGIRNQGEFSKHDAGNGHHKVGMDRLRYMIREWNAEFYRGLKAVETA